MEKPTLRELEELHGGHIKAKSKTGKIHQGGDRCALNHYDLIYEKFLPENVNVLIEVGIFKGTGLRVFSDYYPNARIIGLDISPETCQDPGRAEVYYFDQLSPPDIEKILGEDKADVVIDDGMHRAFTQVNTYKYFQPHMSEGGVYFIEDITISEDMTEYINDCQQFNPRPRRGKERAYGKIAVVTKHTQPLKPAGTEKLKKYRKEFK